MVTNGIEVTDVVILLVKNKVKESNLGAFARLILNDQFIISGVRVIEGKNGPFITFPQEVSKTDGKRYDICFPTTAELRSYITDQVLSQYSLSLNTQAA